MFLHFLIGSAAPQSRPPRLMPLRPATPATEERDLLSAATHGDQSAYSQLVRRHHKMVLSVALRIVHSREDAEEAVQDTFLKAFRYLPGYRGDSSFKTWLYRVARSTALDHLRRKRIRTISPDAPGVAADAHARSGRQQLANHHPRRTGRLDQKSDESTESGR
ncbi:MAG: sigma-70 family RNA polymerase sigma factor [Lewinellaceae bacterium]|nr:sigma-70 family RNA polymerase sigma factor [Lewinellaceae bacterium]